MADLRHTLLADEIRDLKGRLWSGVVALADGDVRKGIYLRRGRFVFAASTVEEDKLGEHLVRTGRVTREQFETALQASQGPGRRLGQALVETGAVPEDALDTLVSEQVRSIALSVFRWTTGEVRYQQVEEPIPSDLSLPLSTERLLLEGTRIFPDAARLEAALGDTRRQVRRAAGLPFDYASIPESPAEKQVLEKAGAGARLADLLSLPFPRPTLVRALSALIAGGLLEEGEAAAAPPPAAASSRALPLSAAPGDETPRAGIVAARTSPTPEPVFTPTPEYAPAPAYGVPAPPLSPEQVERQARDAFDKGDRPRAIALLRQEVARNPAAHGCRRLLAMNLATDAAFSPELEKLFLSTLEAGAKDVELRYRLAVWYKKLGLGPRAILQLKLVLATDSSHAAAWRDLGELEASEGGPGRPRTR